MCDVYIVVFLFLKLYIVHFICYLVVVIRNGLFTVNVNCTVYSVQCTVQCRTIWPLTVTQKKKLEAAHAPQVSTTITGNHTAGQNT